MGKRRFLVYCFLVALLTVFSGLISGCSTIATEKPEDFTSGSMTIPPYGWIEYCKNNPQDTSCRFYHPNKE